MITYSVIQKSQLEGAKRIDAEYYQPEYFKYIETLNNLGAQPIKEIAINVRRNFIPNNEKIFQYIEISEIDLSTGEYGKRGIIGKDAPNRAQWILEKDDIIVSTVRPIRNAVSLIRENADNLVCSSGFAVLKSEKIESEYLFAYLKTKPIIKLLDRKTTASMYPAIIPEDIMNLKIYLGDEKFRKIIKELVIQSFTELDNAKILYSQAENLLLEKLGLKNYKLNDDLFFIIDSSKANDRIDADYFQPKYEKLIEKLELQNAKLLGDLVMIKKGIEPGGESYEEEGKLFIRVSSLSSQGLIDKDQKYLSEDLYKKLQKDYQPQLGEILLTKDATPGIAYVLKEQVEGIIAGGILKLKLQEDIEPEYLSLCINSMVGKMQVERDAGGSVISHWRPEQIKNLLIPILPKPTQQKIADLVRRSHEARKKSKELLDEAKRKVEEMIEKKTKYCLSIVNNIAI